MSIKKGLNIIAAEPLTTEWGAIAGNIQDQADLLQLLTTKADTNSASLSGQPTAPTTDILVNNDQIATTRFVHSAIDAALIDVDALPSQIGHGGDFLTTNGTNASWTTIQTLPSQEGQTDKFLKTNGIEASWETIPTEIPSQEGQSGKFLTTNGTSVSWSNVDLSGKVDKVTSTSSKNRVYIVTPAGEQSVLDTEQTGQTASTIPIRTGTGTIRTATPSDNNDAVNLSYLNTQLNTKLDKITYEWNNALSFGSTGSLCIGKFCCYDSNITVDIDATTSTTYHGTLVIATQNIGTASGGLLVSKVYGDASNTITPNIHIYKHPTGDCMIEVYFTPLPWSKNLIHIRAITLNKDHGSVSYDSVYSDICTNVSEVPAEATIIPDNALDSKQAALVSGTNIKTVNNNSLLGSGNLTIDSLPAQSGQSGKFLTTNGSTASWVNAPTELPAQSGQSGKFLTTNGSSTSWQTVDAFPSQGGNSGKFLTTNGTTVSWATVDALPTQTGQSGKFLTTNGTSASWESLPVVDQTYDGSSANAQSGIAVKSAIDSAISSVYKPAGSVAFANLPTLSSSNLGNVYNVTNDFTTDDRFVEGVGKSYPAGTNVVCINTATSGTAVYKWDVLTGFVDLSDYQLIETAVKHTASTAVGSSSQPVFVDSDGNATAISYTIEKSVPSDAKFTDTTYTQGTGISISGTTINHSNSVTAGTAGTSIATTGSTVDIPYVSYDAQGHITTSGTHTHTVTGFLTSNDVTSTYSSTGTAPVNGTAVASAISTKQDNITGAATTITSSNLTASRALISNSSGKVAVSDVTATELGYLDGVTSNVQTQLDGKVDITGDTMTGNLQLSGAGIYLTSIGSTVSASTSRLNLGTPSNVYAYLTGNTSGAFGIYTEVSGTRKGIACYPDTNFFADATTKTIDLGRSNNVWKTGYINSLSDGSNSITVADIVNKQDELVSGTNIKTINNTTILGSGNIDTHELPSQSGNTGKFLTTDGSSVSWSSVPSNLPGQTGQSGKFLTTDGSSASWATVDALPSQTGHSGDVLKTNGTTASWETTYAMVITDYTS